MSTDPEIPPNFMINPEHLKNFLAALDTQESRIGGMLAELEEKKKQLKHDLAQTKEYGESLRQYKKFMDLKGFGYIKQNTDAWGEEIKKHEEEKKNETAMHHSVVCSKQFDCFGAIMNCGKKILHDGPCGFMEFDEG